MEQALAEEPLLHRTRWQRSGHGRWVEEGKNAENEEQAQEAEESGSGAAATAGDQEPPREGTTATADDSEEKKHGPALIRPYTHGSWLDTERARFIEAMNWPAEKQAESEESAGARTPVRPNGFESPNEDEFTSPVRSDEQKEESYTQGCERQAAEGAATRDVLSVQTWWARGERRLE